jgi:hypothetical protein
MPSHMRPPFIPTDPLLCRADIADDRPSHGTAAAQSLCIIFATTSGLAARRFRQGLRWIARYRSRLVAPQCKRRRNWRRQHRGRPTASAW